MIRARETEPAPSRQGRAEGREDDRNARTSRRNASDCHRNASRYEIVCRAPAGLRQRLAAIRQPREAKPSAATSGAIRQRSYRERLKAAQVALALMDRDIVGQRAKLKVPT